jgi:hypothetical protein
MTDKRQVDHVLNRDRSQQLQRKGQTRAARSKLWAKNISSISARKSHVKPQSSLTHSNKTRSSWRISFTQSSILKTVGEKTKPRPKAGANSFIWKYLAISPLL